MSEWPALTREAIAALERISRRHRMPPAQQRPGLNGTILVEQPNGWTKMMLAHANPGEDLSALIIRLVDEGTLKCVRTTPAAFASTIIEKAASGQIEVFINADQMHPNDIPQDSRSAIELSEENFKALCAAFGLRPPPCAIHRLPSGRVAIEMPMMSIKILMSLAEPEDNSFDDVISRFCRNGLFRKAAASVREGFKSTLH